MCHHFDSRGRWSSTRRAIDMTTQAMHSTWPLLAIDMTRAAQQLALHVGTEEGPQFVGHGIGLLSDDE